MHVLRTTVLIASVLLTLIALPVNAEPPHTTLENRSNRVLVGSGDGTVVLSASERHQRSGTAGSGSETTGGSTGSARSLTPEEARTEGLRRLDRQLRAAYQSCVENAGGNTGACERPEYMLRGLMYPPSDTGAAGGVPAIDPVVIARSALARLPIPMPEAKVGPPPSVNEWNMAAVGYPLWLWVNGTDQYSTTVTQDGITLTLTANRRSTRFTTGDGNTQTCGVTTPWTPSVEPGTPSPTCGHVYQQPSLPGGTYAVTATTVWNVEWTALGQSGTLPFERTGAATELPVGELHALRTR